jgi:hypothetical protein
MMNDGKTALVIILLVCVFFGFIIGFAFAYNHPCLIHEEFRENSFYTEEICLKWRELERLMDKK